MLAAMLLGACAHTSHDGRGEQHESAAPHLRPSATADKGLVQGGRAPAAAAASEVDVSLDRMLTFADERSPTLRVARSERSRAQAAHAGAAVLLPGNPELSVALGPRIGTGEERVDFEVSLKQQLEIAGERGLRLEAAHRLAELTDAEIEQTRWTVHCDVHAVFHRGLVDRERVRLAQRVVTFQQEVLQTVERQVAAGEAAPLTLRIAQAEVAHAQQSLVAAEQSLFASRIRLGQLTGWNSATPPMPAGTLDQPRDPPALDHLQAVARRQLPSLRAGGARIQEARARASLADREAWPRPSLGAQYRREHDAVREAPNQIIMGMLSFTIPVFDLNQGERGRARADVSAAQAELEAALVLLNGQITEAYSEVMAAAARTRAYGMEIVPRFEENLTMLRRAFELGELDILALSTGRERFLRIQSDALDAQQDYFIALAGLERLVGVDLWPDDHHQEQSP